MTGKERCEFLRNIRKNIAEMNGLDYDPHECTHEGWCPGYCPVCDAESADLMRQLERKEAAGSPIRIDTESIKALDKMAKQVYDEEDDNAKESSLIITPDDPGNIEGEMIEVREPMGSMASPHTEKDEVLLPPGMPDYDDIRPPLVPARVEALIELKKKGVKEEQDKICSLCQDCIRFSTISAFGGKAIRCSALSKHFFSSAVDQGICSIKKTVEDDSEAGIDDDDPVSDCGGG